MWAHNGIPDERGVPTPIDALLKETGAAAKGGSGHGVRDIHRIGGGAIDNLRLTIAEEKLNPPGFSVLQAPGPDEAARQMIDAFPNATRLHEKANIIGSSTDKMIASAGFALFPNPTSRFPNHFRVTHPDGVAGFSDENLAGLANVFINTVSKRQT